MDAAAGLQGLNLLSGDHFPSFTSHAFTQLMEEEGGGGAQADLADAVFVEIVVVAQDGDLVGHGGADARPVVYLWGGGGVSGQDGLTPQRLSCNFKDPRVVFDTVQNSVIIQV